MFLRSSERVWLLDSAKKPNTSLLNVIPSLNLTLNLAKNFQTAMSRFVGSLVYHFFKTDVRLHVIVRFLLSGRLLESGVGLTVKHSNSVGSI
jgi:hypothetical protein